jgi:hypothetical protein
MGYWELNGLDFEVRRPLLSRIVFCLPFLPTKGLLAVGGAGGGSGAAGAGSGAAGAGSGAAGAGSGAGSGALEIICLSLSPHFMSSPFFLHLQPNFLRSALYSRCKASQFGISLPFPCEHPSLIKLPVISFKFIYAQLYIISRVIKLVNRKFSVY